MLCCFRSRADNNHCLYGMSHTHLILGSKFSNYIRLSSTKETTVVYCLQNVYESLLIISRMNAKIKSAGRGDYNAALLNNINASQVGAYNTHHSLI